MTLNPYVVPRGREAWLTSFVVACAGTLVGLLYGGALGAARVAPRIHLRPYLDPAWTHPAARPLLALLDAPVAAAVVLGLGAGALALLCEAVVRRAFRAPRPGAAALAAAVVLLAAAWGGVLRFDGHAGILAGFFVAPVALLLVLDAPRPAAWAGVVLAIACAWLHPAWLGAALAGLPACVRASRVRLPRTASAAALLALAAPLGAPAAEASLGLAERLRYGASDLAAAPMLAFSPWRRLDVPTGYEPLMGTYPVAAGLVAFGLVFGAGMMIGGIRRGAACAAAAAVAAFGAALLLPGYVPGDRAVMLPAVLACMPMLALILAGVLPAGASRGVGFGATLAVAAIAALLAHDRAPAWTRIGPALQFAHGRDFAAEPDLARLVVYLRATGLQDPDAADVLRAADALAEGDAPALLPARLRDVLRTSAYRAPPKPPELAQLLAGVRTDLDMAGQLWNQGRSRNFTAVGEVLLEVHPRVLDLHFNWPDDPDSRKAVADFRKMAGDHVTLAHRAAYYEYALPLIGALTLMMGENAESRVSVALERVWSGDLEQGARDLEASLAEIAPRSVHASIARGTLGILKLERGDAKGALADLQAAWNVIAQGGLQALKRTTNIDSAEYYIFAEILLARYEAARGTDPPLAAQAASELEQLLREPLSFGVRRWPALTLMGRLHYLLGNEEQALRLLREARGLPASTLEDRMDGPVGRLAHPRYRRLALSTLIEALGDAPDTAAERDEVRRELEAL